MKGENMGKKLSKAKEAELRAFLYGVSLQGFANSHIGTEPVVKGRLIEVEYEGETYYATLNITLHNPEKFDVEEVRHEYLTKLEAHAQRDAERAEKAKLKAEKAAKKLNK